VFLQAASRLKHAICIEADVDKTGLKRHWEQWVGNRLCSNASISALIGKFYRRLLASQPHASHLGHDGFY